MSKRRLRSRWDQAGPDVITVSDSEIISVKDESASESESIDLENSKDSDFVCISSDDEEPKKKKSNKTKNPRKRNKSQSTKKIAMETVSTKDDLSAQSTSGLHAEPPKKKVRLSPKDKEKKSKAKPKTESKIKLSPNDTETKSKSKVKVKTEKEAKLGFNDTEKKIKPKAKPKTEKKISVKSSSNNLQFTWVDEDLLAEKENLQRTIARSLVKLFEEGNTIPFIARYRQHLTGNMPPEKIRYMKESYDEICELKTKSKTVLNTIHKSGKLTSDIEQSILNCKNLEELEYLYAPYKPANKKSLFERAKALGLEETALALLNGTREIEISSLVQNRGPEGLRTYAEVEKNLVHIIGHIIAHNSDVLTFVRDMSKTLHIKLTTKKSASTKKSSDDENIPKFQNYFDKEFNVNLIKPYQVLAINRGESLKILTVKIVIPDYAFNKFKYFCEQKWLSNTKYNKFRSDLFQETIKEIFTKNITPLMSRKIRSELKQNAHKSAIEVFANNCQQLLLEPPVKGKVIMGIDPGLKQGCKVAVISSTGDVLDTGVIYPHTSNTDVKDSELIKKMLHDHNCSLIAIGNGTACRETESWLTNLIQKNYFHPLNVTYTIVDESGASVYSCSPEAKKEFPDLDPLKISAISLARRIQDPLAELVKVDPKSLGVGMYQHDLNQKMLDSTLDEVISACVSFVGVDLNTASHCLLRRVAGLTAQRASNIINYRQEKGPFTNRYQVKDVKGIGDKSFEQSAGFLRIIPTKQEAPKFYERPDATPLDCTDIHPETYEVVDKILEDFKLFYNDIGSPSFISQFKEKVKSTSVEKLAKQYEKSEQTINLIIDALSKPLAYDLRSENTQGPIFKKNITTIADLKPGALLTGRVTNVVAFGAFVDIGVGKSGLIHKSRMNGEELLVTQRVEVKVLNIENKGQKIGLELRNILR